MNIEAYKQLKRSINDEIEEILELAPEVLQRMIENKITCDEWYDTKCSQFTIRYRPAWILVDFIRNNKTWKAYLLADGRICIKIDGVFQSWLGKDCFQEKSIKFIDFYSVIPELIKSIKEDLVHKLDTLENKSFTKMSNEEMLYEIYHICKKELRRNNIDNDY